MDPDMIADASQGASKKVHTVCSGRRASGRVSAAVEGVAAAQYPKSSHLWKKNADGPRLIDDAVAFVRQQGVSVPPDVRFVVAPPNLLDDGVYAFYAGFKTTLTYRWEALCVKPRDDGEEPTVVVKVRASVLESDAEILAVFSHELYELAELRAMFEVRQSIPGAELLNLVRAGNPGNVHDRAWDEGDLRVTKWLAP